MEMEPLQSTSTQPPQADWLELNTDPGPPDDGSDSPSFWTSLGERHYFWPLTLFVLTCLSTYSIQRDWLYALCVMTILVCHEAGHFIQAWRHGVYASLPYFIPVPITPIGTAGAVIAMEAHVGDRKAVFDIGITGPLAGLVPTLVFCIVGLQSAKYVEVRKTDPPVQDISRHSEQQTLEFGEPLLYQWIRNWAIGPSPKVAPPTRGQKTSYRYVTTVGAMAYAGWVGLLITSLNLFPIGQLDGGHILYAILRHRSHYVAWAILAAAAIGIFVASVVFGNLAVLGWLLMIGILLAMGPRHPPTADDEVSLGWPRTILGWATIAFVVVGFTPTPFLS
jgi:membrane-associated protease RseP (regulator of RpoE activity)